MYFASAGSARTLSDNEQLESRIFTTETAAPYNAVEPVDIPRQGAGSSSLHSEEKREKPCSFALFPASEIALGG